MTGIAGKEIDPRVTPFWYALYTRSRAEKKVDKELTNRGIEHFLPLIRQVRQWSDRKKIVEMPLFPGYVFVNIRLKDRIPVLQSEGAVRLVSFNGKPAPIPRSQVEDVRRLLGGQSKPKLEPFAYFNVGDWVKIVHGPFAGVKGKLIQHRGQTRLLVGIALIEQAVSVEVELSWVRRLDQTQPDGKLGVQP